MEPDAYRYGSIAYALPPRTTSASLPGSKPLGAEPTVVAPLATVETQSLRFRRATPPPMSGKAGSTGYIEPTTPTSNHGVSAFPAESNQRAVELPAGAALEPGPAPYLRTNRRFWASTIAASWAWAGLVKSMQG